MAVRLALALAFGVFAWIFGPAWAAPKGTAAGEPFAYAPPEGFVSPAEARGDAGPPPPADEQKDVWIHPPGVLKGYVPRVFVTHSPARGTLGSSDVEQLGRDMPELFAKSNITWRLLRTDVRVRGDGVRVGVIEGEGQQKELRLRTTQLVFPEDQGTALVTATFREEDADAWAPKVEATIDRARGVSRPAPAPPAWSRYAWGAGGALLGFVLAGLLRRREPKPERRERDDEGPA